MQARKITGVKIETWPANNYQNKKTALRTEQFPSVSIKTLSQVVKDVQSSSFNLLDFFFSQAVATSCAIGKTVNPSIREKTRFSLDRPVSFKGKTVPANTNLLKFQKFDGAFYNVSVSELAPSAIGGIYIMNDFGFQPGRYTGTVSWQTTRNETFSDSFSFDIK